MSNILKKIRRLLELPNQLLVVIDRLNALEAKLDRIKQEVTYSVQDQSYKMNSVTEKMIDNHFFQLESLIYILRTLPNIKELPPTRGWAGSPDFLAQLIKIIIDSKPDQVLELGSGTSTVVIGSALIKNDHGKVISLDHEIKYANLTRENLKFNGIDSLSSVFHCPLREYQINGEKWLWYDISQIRLNHKINLLIIDGPPGSLQKMSRYPAIPLLFEHFAVRTTVVLDDSKREDETLVVKKWLVFLEQKGCKVLVEEFGHFEKGMTVLKIDSSYSSIDSQQEFDKHLK